MGGVGQVADQRQDRAVAGGQRQCKGPGGIGRPPVQRARKAVQRRQHVGRQTRRLDRVTAQRADRLRLRHRGGGRRAEAQQRRTGDGGQAVRFARRTGQQDGVPRRIRLALGVQGADDVGGAGGAVPGRGGRGRSRGRSRGRGRVYRSDCCIGGGCGGDRVRVDGCCSGKGCCRGGGRGCGGGCGFGEPRQVMRAARLGSGAGKPLAAKGLAAHHRADLVAVDIDVADLQSVDDALHRSVDAAVQAKRQAIAGGVDGIDHRVDFGRLECGDMQDGAENLARHRVDAGHAQQRRGDEMAGGRGGQRLDQPAFAAGGVDIGRNAVGCGGVDQRAGVGIQLPRVARRQILHRALQHLQNGVGHVLLHVKAPQRRTPLPRRLKGRGEDVAHCLFGQRGAVHQHRVQTAGFRDQRRGRVQMGGHAGPDRQRGGGRSGEGHARDPGIAGQRRPHRPVAGQQLQRGGWHARLQHQVGRQARDQRGLRRGFGEHGIASRQRRRDLPGKDRQRKVPRADAREQPTRRGGQALGLVGVVAQEIDRLAQFANAIGQGLARLAREQRKDRTETRLI